MVLDIMGRLNHHSIDNSDMVFYPLEYPFVSASEYVPYPETTSIKLFNDDKID